MPVSWFDLAYRYANLGLRRFTSWMPVFVRAVLLLLFVWYGLELSAKIFGLAILGILLVCSAISFFTWLERRKKGPTPPTSLPAGPPPAESPPVVAVPLWPFLLMNLLMILLVAAIDAWDRGRGWADFSKDQGLLGFTQYWIQRIVSLLRGA